VKKVEAIIRPDKLDTVMEKLEGLTYPGATITEVRGHGKQMGVRQVWRGTEYSVRYLSKMKLEVVVLDEDAGKVVSAIVSAARTGNIGDGKVFVSDVADAVRVRTGESGDRAI
jgi:nitrogen regulatory protein P-II 1